MMSRHSVRLGGFSILIFALAGCSALQSGSNEAKAVAVEPAPNAGFIAHPERLKTRADLPFQKVWIKPGFDKSRYQNMVVAPVNTQYMLEMDWMHELSSATWLSDVKADIQALLKNKGQPRSGETGMFFMPPRRARAGRFAGGWRDNAVRRRTARRPESPSSHLRVT